MKTKNKVTYGRKPTAYELKFGYGARHYRDFPIEECINEKRSKETGLTILKKRIKAKNDGLIYTR